jgi:hypothetical protein
VSTPVDILFQMADEVRRELLRALAITSNGTPKQSYVAHGNVSWDNCCDGLLYIQFARIFIADGTVDAAQPTTCGRGLAADLNVTLLRCAPAPATNGPNVKLPTPAELSRSALGMMEDGVAVMALLRSLAAAWRDVRYIDTVIGAWAPLGPDGGCQGGTLTMTVELPPTASLAAAPVEIPEGAILTEDGQYLVTDDGDFVRQEG